MEPDELHPQELRELADVIRTNITPMFKKCKKEDPGNYRPVILTSVAVKVMESQKLGAEVISGVLWESILGPILFNIFVNDLDDGAECKLRTFADDTKLGGVADMSDGCATIQRDLDKVNWAKRNLTKFNKWKCKVLHMGRNNSRHQHMQEAKWLEGHLAEKDLGVLVDKELAMS
ncbi:hypothetical protein QYF61_017937 [Mycteria americana]|uniref:Rna-directed dna polymerase from mobile element jockey-like n=1 Tax=Mycteria americana TaxID=33587 RepID=A0AAN7NGT6_MYCAM|nr:hypothetical protein QYF61_017937 [Mycteria americana]